MIVAPALTEGKQKGVPETSTPFSQELASA
ncbi:hypothetical protein MCEMIH15_00224 [Caulobacteraceae bacterium]